MGVGTRRLVIWGVLLGVLAAGIVYALRPRAVPVDLATVDRGVLRVTIDEEGATRVSDIYVLYAPLSGWLLRIDAQAGDPVEANATEVARIEPAPPEFIDVRTEAERMAAAEAARAARDLATASLQRAQADLMFASSELDRARRLVRQGTLSQRDLEDAERSFRVAEADVATAQAALNVRQSELAQAQARLLTRLEITQLSATCECVPVTAPVSGEVLRVLRQSAGIVSAGTPLVEIGNPRDLEVVVELLSEDAVTIDAGQRAAIVGWGGPDLTGVVRRIEPYGQTRVSALGIEEQRVAVVIDLTDPPATWHRLGHGYRVDVRLILFEEEVLRLPLGALFRDGDGWAVFVEDQDQARLRPVKIGARNSLFVEVTGGLSAGDRVVLYPGSQIMDGVSIVAR